MSLRWAENPKLFSVKAREMPLSGFALVALMKAVLARGVPFRFCARGWSMTPFIRDGDVITIEPLTGTIPRIGDVVAFTRGEDGKLVVHRVVDRNRVALRIQGDSTPGCPDGIVPFEDVLGRVKDILRNGKKVSLGLGLERYIIAWLSRAKLVLPLSLWLANLRKHFL